MTQPRESSQPGPAGSGLALDHEIDRFLTEHPDLRPLVHETLNKAAAYFPNAEPRLELVHDPEDDSDTLVMFLRTEQDVNAGEREYDRFVDEWWLDRKREAGTRFAVMMVYA